MYLNGKSWIDINKALLVGAFSSIRWVTQYFFSILDVVKPSVMYLSTRTNCRPIKAHFAQIVLSVVDRKSSLRKFHATIGTKITIFWSNLSLEERRVVAWTNQSD